MIDASNDRPIQVSTDGGAGPYVAAPVDQIESIRRVLDEHGVSYWVDSHAVSLDGKPFVVVVNLSQDCDPIAVQELLDNAS